jgi:hypothetical protein
MIIVYQAEYDEIYIEYKWVNAELDDVGIAIENFPPGYSNSIRKQAWNDLLYYEKQLIMYRNRLNDELNRRHKGLVSDRKKQQLFEEFSQKQKEFLNETQEPTAEADEIKHKYAELDKDEAVRKALVEVNRLAKTKLVLGPTPDFTKRRTGLITAVRNVKADLSAPKRTGRRKNRPSSKVALNAERAPRGGRSAPADKGKMKSASN